MADFVPFRSGRGFRPHVFSEQLAALVEAAEPEAVRAVVPEPVAAVPDHTAGVSRSPLDRTMPEPNGTENGGAPAALGPSPEDVARLVAEAEQRARSAAEAEAAERLAEQEARFTSELRRLEAVVAGLQEYREVLAAEARDACGRLVVQAVRRVAVRTPEVLDAVLEARCAEVAESMVGGGAVTVRVHPDDMTLAGRLLGERPGWRLVPDPALKGGCIAEGEAGRMDASLDAGLDAIQEAVKAWRAERRASE